LVSVDVTDETFYTDVVQRSHDQPVVVDFWADWCAPCKALTPVLEQEVAARDGQIALAKVDVDANPQLADHYNVRSIPAVKAFREGRVVSEFTGAQSALSVSRFLDELLAPRVRLVDELREAGEEPEIVAALDSSDFEAALAVLLARAQTGDGEARDRARKLMVRIFEELGQDDPLATRYRRQLATALY
jgi:putative thioredoxin